MIKIIVLYLVLDPSRLCLYHLVILILYVTYLKMVIKLPKRVGVLYKNYLICVYFVGITIVLYNLVLFDAGHG
jgi:hypothetical protein